MDAGGTLDSIRVSRNASVTGAGSGGRGNEKGVELPLYRRGESRNVYVLWARLVAALGLSELSVVADKAQARSVCRMLPKSVGGIGFRRLQSNVVNFARRGAAAFTRTVSLSNNHCAIGMHCYSHPSDIDG